MKTKKLMLGMIFLILIGNVCALTTNIDIKPSFSENEEVYFDYSILSNKDINLTYLVSVDCPSLPVPLLSYETVSLQKDITFTDKYTYLTVPAEAESQECRALLSVTEPEEVTDERYFSITTEDSFDFKISLAKKVFVKGENIVINYESSVEPEINAVLTYPDGTTKQITLPATIVAEQIGTYNLEVTASKEGYKTATETMQFGVIEKQADIKEGPPQEAPIETAPAPNEVTPENQAGEKEAGPKPPEGEVPQQEITSAAQEEGKNNIDLIIIVAGIILIIISIYLLLRNKKFM
jgi:hypothetical protein